LVKINPVKDGTGALNAAIVDVTKALDAAEASAGSSGVLGPEVQQVKTAIAALQSAANGVTADNVRQKAPAIASATVQVVTATRALSTALIAACPGS
jgi:hypothetical protein